jgi:hypothetical protein
VSGTIWQPPVWAAYGRTSGFIGSGRLVRPYRAPDRFPFTARIEEDGMLSRATRDRRMEVLARKIETMKASATKLRERADAIDQAIEALHTEVDWLATAPVSDVPAAPAVGTDVPSATPQPVDHPVDAAVLDPALVDNPELEPEFRGAR